MVTTPIREQHPPRRAGLVRNRGHERKATPHARHVPGNRGPRRRLGAPAGSGQNHGAPRRALSRESEVRVFGSMWRAAGSHRRVSPRRGVGWYLRIGRQHGYRPAASRVHDRRRRWLRRPHKERAGGSHTRMRRRLVEPIRDGGPTAGAGHTGFGACGSPGGCCGVPATTAPRSRPRSPRAHRA